MFKTSLGGTEILSEESQNYAPPMPTLKPSSGTRPSHSQRQLSWRPWQARPPFCRSSGCPLTVGTMDLAYVCEWEKWPKSTHCPSVPLACAWSCRNLIAFTTDLRSDDQGVSLPAHPHTVTPTPCTLPGSLCCPGLVGSPCPALLYSARGVQRVIGATPGVGAALPHEWKDLALGWGHWRLTGHSGPGFLGWVS